MSYEAEIEELELIIAKCEGYIRMGKLTIMAFNVFIVIVLAVVVFGLIVSQPMSVLMGAASFLGIFLARCVMVHTQSKNAQTIILSQSVLKSYRSLIRIVDKADALLSGCKNASHEQGDG